MVQVESAKFERLVRGQPRDILALILVTQDDVMKEIQTIWITIGSTPNTGSLLVEWLCMLSTHKVPRLGTN